MKKTLCPAKAHCVFLFAFSVFCLAPLPRTAADTQAAADSLPVQRPVRETHKTERDADSPVRWHGDGIEMDIPVPEHPLVEKFRVQYSGSYGKKWLEAVMENGAPYRSYIETKLREYGLPECLVYLPVIESNFLTTAVSKSGAMGMWQFMKNSIGPFGIRINEWMDERRDPWLTTDAALKKLGENYDYFGDWYLALAAYNSGLGAVARAVKAAGKQDYWYLADNGFLKTETVNYVPKFLAVAEILTHSGRNGITPKPAEPLPAFDTIDVKKAVDITLLAREAGIDAKLLKTFNPALYYHITPPGTRYSLRVPAAARDDVERILSDSASVLVNYYIYKIKSGDTLYALSLHYGVSVDMIKEYNPGIREQSLRIGQSIVIPAFKDVEPFTGKKAGENLVFDGQHTVLKGETLWSISLQYAVQVETLAEKNNMDVDSILRTGSTLKVPILE